MGLLDWLFGKKQPAKEAGRTTDASESEGHSGKPKIKVNAEPAPGDVVIEIGGGPTICIPRGSSLTIGSGPETDCRVGGCGVAPKHVRIDNRIVPPGYDASHPYCGMVWVADIGGASIGEDLFGPRSRTGVVIDLESRSVMPLELGETALLRVGTIVLLGELQFRVLSEG